KGIAAEPVEIEIRVFLPPVKKTRVFIRPVAKMFAGWMTVSGEDRFAGVAVRLPPDRHEEDVQRLREGVVAEVIDLLRQQQRREEEERERIPLQPRGLALHHLFRAGEAQLDLSSLDMNPERRTDQGLKRLNRQLIEQCDRLQRGFTTLE